MPSSSRVQRRRISPVDGNTQQDLSPKKSNGECNCNLDCKSSLTLKHIGRHYILQMMKFSLPMALGGQRTAAVSPAGVIFHTTLEKLSSPHISWGSAHKQKAKKKSLTLLLNARKSSDFRSWRNTANNESCVAIHRPGHFFSLQRRTSSCSPGQGCPPKKGP